MNYIFLSAHFDDAIGSCGETISALVRQGCAVEVHTIFGGRSRPPYSAFAQSLHREWGCFEGDPVAVRQREDADACSVLGCTSVPWDLPEAIYRRANDGAFLYPDMDALFGRIADADSGLASRISCSLWTKLKAEPETWVVFAPLGIGCHADHVILTDAGMRLCSFGQKVLFYRDFYYEQPTVPQAQMQRNAERYSFSEKDVDRLLRAFACYSTQIPMLFDNWAGAVTYLRNRVGECRVDEGYAATYWDKGSLTALGERLRAQR